MGATELLLVRHGQSAANVAAAYAESIGAEQIDVPARDADVELSDTGLEQARALGVWLAGLPAAHRPQAVWSSPYRRAADTARTALAESGLDVPLLLDERLRDRDLGITDTLTSAGVRARYPEEAERRRWLGKFYHRPPGGESWADVALRVRSVLADLERQDRADRVLITCHDAVVLLFRYVCEHLGETDVLAIGRDEGVRNAAVTQLVTDGDGWRLAGYNVEEHLAEQGAATTEEPPVGETPKAGAAEGHA
ncbi:histidine phosphatase family protein [Georgenia yuyongxinii]|uniref:Histidine phosphatase family protein n=1 Tax=Georgenia yuyongxinii TaxID=2589797 RepID=A0A5B8BZ50_9MICO|nr:histidine phosphatase family protein [Georgenia yuyongxinii]QDC23583.1 histidine phosphatase family protein [Georgenia yuyongxinii]